MSLLILDGINFNDIYINKESYVVEAENEIKDQYIDANDQIHESRSNNTTYEINFKTHYLDQTGLAYVRDMITSKRMVEVDFYDTNTDTFITGATFIVQAKNSVNLYRSAGTKKLYKPITIKLYGYTKIAE